jgi:hypothetical protein
MATKFYLPSTGTATVDPAWSTSWYNATAYSASKLNAVTTKISSAMSTKSMTEADVTDRSFAVGMWISDRLKPQAIAAQTVTISIKCSEDNAKNNLYVKWIIRLLHADNTYGDTILAFTADGLELALTAAIASRFDTQTSTAVTAVGGDRIVIEIGTGGDPASGGGSHNASMIIGDDAAADLDAADADTGVDNPWVNFGTTTLEFMRDRNFVTHM